MALFREAGMGHRIAYHIFKGCGIVADPVSAACRSWSNVEPHARASPKPHSHHLAVFLKRVVVVNLVRVHEADFDDLVSGFQGEEGGLPDPLAYDGGMPTLTVLEE